MNQPSRSFASFLKSCSLYFLLMMPLYHLTCFADQEAPSKEERKTVIVTGASGELGSATARLLASDYHLILTGRNLSKLQALQEELKANHSGHYLVCPVDFLSSSSINHFKEYLNQLSVSLSGLVLVTPRPQFYGQALIPDEEIWIEALRSTFTGPMETLKSVLPHLSKSGKIVVIAGTTSVQYQPTAGASCVIRRMWTTYTKALSHQLGQQGITINCLSPGIVLTQFHQERIEKKAKETGSSYENQMKQDVANIPLRRHADPKEVAQTIRFLLSNESNFINGINLVLDGGFTMSYQ